ncbi:hypothetical protein TNCT_403481 [Trichonephila clavata]|uniref:Uncharacterized protein n=1 Tax=Trichonephila clavata TaxID=2740835 RepID=A0A8X6LRU9_TRICU|nr:hypothetical protein TNCT_403481 [Trichonephila clavata]
MNGTGRDGSKGCPDIKSGHCDPESGPALYNFRMSVLGQFPCFVRIHCVLKCLGSPLTGLKHESKGHGVWTAGKRNPRWRERGKTILFSVRS